MINLPLSYQDAVERGINVTSISTDDEGYSFGPTPPKSVIFRSDLALSDHEKDLLVWLTPGAVSRRFLYQRSDA